VSIFFRPSMTVAALPPRVHVDRFEDWADFDAIKGSTLGVGDLASPSSVVPLIDFNYRKPGPMHLAYMEDDGQGLPPFQQMSIADWIDSTSDGVAGGILELQAAWTFQFSTPSITSDVLLHIAAFLFGEAIEKLHSNPMDGAPLLLLSPRLAEPEE
jgi:hypothetical protein